MEKLIIIYQYNYGNMDLKFLPNNRKLFDYWIPFIDLLIGILSIFWRLVRITSRFFIVLRKYTFLCDEDLKGDSPLMDLGGDVQSAIRIGHFL